jgi:hypothetical protein
VPRTCTFDVIVSNSASPTLDNGRGDPQGVQKAYASSRTASDRSDGVACDSNASDSSFPHGRRQRGTAGHEEGARRRAADSVNTAADAEVKMRSANDEVGVCSWEALLGGLSRCLATTSEYEDCEVAAPSCLVLTGVVAGPLAGGRPKALELYVGCDVADLSAYGLGFADDGGGSDGQE